MSNDIDYVNKHIEEVETILGERDVVKEQNTDYKGPGAAKLFGVSQDVEQLRLGRRHHESHQDFQFTKNSGRPFGIYDVGYSVFVPATGETVDNIKAGKPFTFYVGNEVKEDSEGNVIGLVDTSQRTGTIQTLVDLMPKKRIPKVMNLDVKVGDSLTSNVPSSNVDDNGDHEIFSETGRTSLLYNPSSGSFEPAYIGWGSPGWMKPTKTNIKGDTLFFDDRESNAEDAGIWMIKFNEKGYKADKVD